MFFAFAFSCPFSYQTAFKKHEMLSQTTLAFNMFSGMGGGGGENTPGPRFDRVLQCFEPKIPLFRGVTRQINDNLSC